MEGERLIRTAELRHYVPYGRSRVLQMVKAGTFPAPLKISPRRNAWRYSDIQDWIARVAQSAA